MEWLTLALVLITAWYAISTQLMLKEMKRQRESAEGAVMEARRQAWILLLSSLVSPYEAAKDTAGQPKDFRPYARIRELIQKLEDYLEQDFPGLDPMSAIVRPGAGEVKITGQQPDVTADSRGSPHSETGSSQGR